MPSLYVFSISFLYLSLVCLFILVEIRGFDGVVIPLFVREPSREKKPRSYPNTFPFFISWKLHSSYELLSHE